MTSEIALSQNDAERACVASVYDCLFRGRHDLIAAIDGFSPEWIFDPHLRVLFQALVRISKKRQYISDGTLAYAIHKILSSGDGNKLKMADVMKLVHSEIAAPMWSQIMFNCEQVYLHWLWREAKSRLGEIIESESPESILSKVESLIQQLRRECPWKISAARQNTQKRLLEKVLDDIENPAAEGIDTGLEKLDEFWGSFRPGTLAIFGAPTSGGKSVMLGQIAVRAAQAGKPTLFLPFEMNYLEVIKRWGCLLGNCTLEDKTALEAGVSMLAPLMDGDQKLIIDDGCKPTINAIEAKVKGSAKQLGLKLVVVDYLQMLSIEPRLPIGRSEALEQIANRLKALALDTGICLVTASQYNRAGQENPTLHSFRDSGGIEQACDYAILMKPPSEEDRQGMDVVTVEVRVAKNRNGPRGVTSIRWNMPKFAFYAAKGTYIPPQNAIPGFEVPKF